MIDPDDDPKRWPEIAGIAVLILASLVSVAIGIALYNGWRP